MKTKKAQSAAQSTRRAGLLVVTLIGIMSGLFLAQTGILLPAALANNEYYYLDPSDPLILNWSNPALITQDDDWSGIRAVNGFIGDYSQANPVGVDPQTILTDFPTALDVNANRNDPNTFNVEGVTEFDGIANPTIALKGGPNADAPYLQIRLNTQNCPASKFINVSYKVRDIDGSANNAVQQVALQYRVGPSGNYTNVPMAFVADATTGPNEATLVTPVLASLPAITINQPEVYLRIMTANAAGADEWVGIDDINVACTCTTAATGIIGGRITTADGRAVPNVIVNAAGGAIESARTVRTNSFGYYEFADLPTGANYVVSIGPSKYIFKQSTMVLNLSDDFVEADFTAAAR
jgi:Carboxypeptidase regulatory-like domain